MRIFPLALLMTASLTPLLGQAPASVAAPATTPNAVPGQAPTQIAQVLERVVAREKEFDQSLNQYQPRIETYVQEMAPNNDVGTAPRKDHYFLGRLDMHKGLSEVQFRAANGSISKGSMFPLARFFALQYNPAGFVDMVSPDERTFDTAHYSFAYQGREFLGDVRCIMFDVAPRKSAIKTGFMGRIWVEDQDYTIVRFDGTFAPAPRFDRYFHFDSWRMNIGPGRWLPAAIYVEEGDVQHGIAGHTSLKGQTRLWGYDLKAPGSETDLTDVQVESPAPITDESDTTHDYSPLEQQRRWEAKAEHDVLVRMERAGLLSPPGEVDKVLETVVNNLIVTNNLTIEPDVHCRVLLTTPLESFTVGHTIVVSRGLIDVLPDESSLAMVLAHELGHIALGHKLDTRYAFDDRMMFTDEQVFQALRLARSPEEEAAADAKGIELLEHSPYKDKLGSAGLFLEAVARQAPELPNLLAPHLGNPMAIKGRVERMKALLASAPQLQPRDLKQQAALPLAGRLRLDPWSDELTLSHAHQVAMLSSQDKLSFEITPFEPYLTRTTGSPLPVAAGKPGDK